MTSAPTSWAELSGRLQGRLVRAGDSGWDQARHLQNPRFDDAAPLAVARAASLADVQACLAYAERAGLPVALRSGGHCYTGWSAGGSTGTGVPASLVISTTDLTQTSVRDELLTVGPGAHLIDVYSTVAAAGRAIGGGTCPTVAIGGLTLGGGIGVLARQYGLTCDQLQSVTIITTDGTIHRVTAQSSGLDADLFWASRGGGGGTVGVVTEMTFRTQPAPQITRFEVPIDFAAAAEAVMAWQTWLPGTDRRLWTSLQVGAGPRRAPAVSLVGTWTGTPDALSAQLDGLRRGAPGAFPRPSSPAVAATGTYLEAMRYFAGCATIPAQHCTTGPGGSLRRTSQAATSAIAYTMLQEYALSALLEQIHAAQSVPGLRNASVLMDALGGAVADPSPTDTAFVHRKALFSMQFDATFIDGTDPAPYDTWVRAARGTVVSSLGDHAYVNYPDASLTDPGSSYFGQNHDRLRDIRHHTDPHQRFSQPR